LNDTGPQISVATADGEMESASFCREELTAWCEANRVDYLFGVARNQRLRRVVGKQMHQARR
jgi:hypothetical protein